MKIYGVYSKENEILKDEWFLKTLQDDVEVHFKDIGSFGGASVDFGDANWYKACREKHNYACQAVEENQGDLIIYSDVDIQFFDKCIPAIVEAMEGKDIVFQSEHWPATGEINLGFLCIRCSPKTLKLYREIRDMEFEKLPVADQTAMNMLLKDGKHDIQWGVFPTKIWARSHGNIPPDDILMHHANCVGDTIGKSQQLVWIRKMVLAGPGSVYWIYKKYLRMKPKVRQAYYNLRKTVKKILLSGGRHAV